MIMGNVLEFKKQILWHFIWNKKLEVINCHKMVSPLCDVCHVDSRDEDLTFTICMLNCKQTWENIILGFYDKNNYNPWIN